MSERAKVTTATPLLVTLDSGDEELPASRLAFYTPVLNDRVAVERLGSGLLVIGKVV